MLCTSQKHIVYTVVEPSKTAMKEFQELVKNKYSSVEFRWFCMTWQDFQDKEWKKDDGSLYNIIHFVHSAYYIVSSVEELRERIPRCYSEMLKNGGAIISLLGNSKGKNCFTIPAKDSLPRIWCHGPEFGVFAKVAEDHGWKVDGEESSHKVDVSKCFDEDSEEGNQLLNFFTHTKDYRVTAPKEELELTMKKLEERTDGVSKIVYPCVVDVTTIWKETI